METPSIFDTPISSLGSQGDVTPLSSWSAHSKLSGRADIFSPRTTRGWLNINDKQELDTRLHGIESRLFGLEAQLKTTNSLLEQLVSQDDCPDTPDPFNPFQTGFGPLDYVPPAAHLFPSSVLHLGHDPHLDVKCPVREHSSIHPPRASELDLKSKTTDPKKTSAQHERPQSPLFCAPAPLQRAHVPYADAAKGAASTTGCTQVPGIPFVSRVRGSLAESAKHAERPRDPRQMTFARSVLLRDSAEACISLQLELKSSITAISKGAIASVAQNIVPLSLHRYGNYAVQRALTIDAALAQMLVASSVTLALSQFGTFVLCCAIDRYHQCATAVADQLLSSRLYYTLTSRNALHVWRKLMTAELPEAQICAIASGILRVLRGRVFDVVTQEVGFIVFQSLIQGGVVSHSSELATEIFHRFRECACNQWGAWVTQCLVENGDAATREKAMALVLRESEPLSLSQYGAKAIQAALRTGGEQFCRDYAAIICGARRSTNSTRPLLVDMGTASHGLHIVTNVLTSCPNEVRSSIVHLVRSNAAYLKNNKTGVRLFQLCERARAFTGY